MSEKIYILYSSVSNRKVVRINWGTRKFFKSYQTRFFENSWEFNSLLVVEETLSDTLKSKQRSYGISCCFYFLKITNFWIKSILLRTKWNNSDKMKLKEQKFINKEFKWSAKHIKFII